MDEKYGVEEAEKKYADWELVELDKSDTADTADGQIASAKLGALRDGAAIASTNLRS